MLRQHQLVAVVLSRGRIQHPTLHPSTERTERGYDFAVLATGVCTGDNLVTHVVVLETQRFNVGDKRGRVKRRRHWVYRADLNVKFDRELALELKQAVQEG